MTGQPGRRGGAGEGQVHLAGKGEQAAVSEVEATQDSGGSAIRMQHVHMETVSVRELQIGMDRHAACCRALRPSACANTAEVIESLSYRYLRGKRGHKQLQRLACA